MEEIIKQDKGKSHKEFEKLLSEDLNNRSFREGEIATGVVEDKLLLKYGRNYKAR